MVRVGGSELAWREGMTVADVLSVLGDPYPYALVRVGERLVTAPHFSSAAVPDGSEIILLHLVPGG